ncbi:MAG: response regulator transcription factor [Eubacteriales bacterium]|nr:response regulator transcription factor [Eubacteriales bacterium]
MKILLVEDDKDLCQALSWQLKKEHFTVDCCFRGDEAELYLKEKIYDLLLLDCMLPGISGISILKKMRAAGDFTPVIILSALGEVKNRVTGLNEGADDYLVKPFAFSELMARINSLFRRKAAFHTEAPSFGDLTLELDKNRLVCKERFCSLSQTECMLISLLLQAKGSSLQRSFLLHKVWGLDTCVEDGNLDNYIYFLRKRLKTLNSCVSIRNLRGRGYYLEES